MTRKATARLGLAMAGVFAVVMAMLPGHTWAGQEADVVKVMATAQESPPRITLDWPRVVNSGGFKIYRKNMEAKAWGTAYATISEDTATTFIDDNVSVCVGYEYNVETVKTMGDSKGHGYIYSGIALPPVDSRGKVILLVDETMAAALPGEIERLEWDLAGDGWTILRHDVPRSPDWACTNTEVSAIKTIIRNDYQSDPNNVKCVFLLGRVALPKFYGEAPDGHGPNWLVFDTHYSMPDVNWTGSYGLTPSMIKLDVGRVDMSNNDDVFQLSEVELLRRYLHKHHAFRNRLTAFQTRGVVSGGWWEDHWKMQTWVGRDKWEEGRFDNIEQTPSLWDHGEGLAYMNTATPSRYASHKYQSVFAMCGGSGGWNFDSGAGVLKPSLASPGANLAHVYSYSPTRFFHWMALGQTLGTSERLATANYSLYFRSYTPVHRGLCGDPTLRMHILAPPGGLKIVDNTLSWEASPDAGTDGFSGYHVYRGASRAGPFTRQTTNLVVGTSWTDPAPSNALYQVRAIRLETTSVGSYYNNSAGAFATRGQVGIVPSVRWLSVPEARTAIFQVKLSSPPASNVTVTAARTGGDSDITVQSGGSLTFTPANWNLYQPVTLAAARDDGQSVDGPATITLSAPGLSDVTVGATEEDLIIETSHTKFTVPENGSASLNVRLSGPPVGNVTVTTTKPDGCWNLSIQSGASLTFTPDNWDEWQSVTIANADSPTEKTSGTTLTLSASGYRSAEVDTRHGERNGGLSVAANNDSYGTVMPSDTTTCILGEPTPISAIPKPGYRFGGWSVSADRTPVTIADPSAPITTMIRYYDNSSSGDTGDSGGANANFLAGSTGPALVTIERDCQSIYVPAGGTTNMRIRLSAQPAGTVTVNWRKTKDAAIWVQQSSFTFTTANWSQWQTVTLGCAEHDPGRVPTSYGGGEVSRQDEIEFSGTGLVSSRLHVYEANKCQLTSWAGIGGVEVTPAGMRVVKKGWNMAISARANTGYRFDRWEVRSGQAAFANARSANTTVTLDGDATIQAEFARVEAAQPPTCAFASPVGHVAVKAGTNLTLAATAASAALGTTVSKVEFYRNGARIGEDLSAPYSCVWSNVPVGTHTLTARAIDSEGVAGDLVMVWVTATASGVWNSLLASGGDEVYDFVTNGIAYRVHTFMTPGWMPDTKSFVVSSTGSSDQVEYLVVAGGGGGSGGAYQNGGGGAGGMLAGATSVVAQIYPITVGAGGGAGGSGGNSSLGFMLLAIGGGKGVSSSPGGDGGSGGGVGGYSGTGGSGTPGQGNNGTYGNTSPFRGGAGGGAGAAPAARSTTGGIGRASSITGTNATYARGGDGSSRMSAGAEYPGADGAANTGNGGGGAGNSSSAVQRGGAGGSGIVIVRYVIPDAVFPVMYHANGATGGTVPSAQIKTYGVSLTLAVNSGSLVRTGYSFAGWNTAANGTGTDYAVESAYTANAGLTLYAKWTAASYPVTYDANQANGGTVPEAQTKTHGVSLTLAVNTGGLVRNGYALAGWNTEASGLGTDYAFDSAYTVNAAVTLYAKWLVSGSRAPVIVTPAFATPSTVTMPPGATTVGVVCDANGGDPLRYEWRKESGPGTATFSSPGTPDSGVTFSEPGTYLLRVSAVNIRGETVSSDVTVAVIGAMTDLATVSVPEGGTNTFRVKLTAQPAGGVTVVVARVSGDTDMVVQSGASLTFTTTNWGTYQTVTLAADQDGDTENGSTIISLSSAGGIVGVPVTATEADNDTTLWINATAGGTVSPAGNVIGTKGSAVSIQAIANSGYAFMRWVVTDGAADIANTLVSNTTVTLNEPATIRANFMNNANPGLTETWTWGYNGYGQLGDGSSVNSLWPKTNSFAGADTIAGGYYHTVAHKPDGSVWAWGGNSYGELGTVTAPSLSTNPVQSLISGVTKVAAGDCYTVALKTNGTVWSWGQNNYGKLGDGNASGGRRNPVQVVGITDAMAFGAGRAHMLVAKADGTVWAWGSNWYGQLGDGTNITRYTPVQAALSNVSAVAAGYYHTTALKDDGTVWAWGYNTFGQLGNGTNITRWTPVQAALSNVSAVAAGDYYTVAVKDDGTVWAWGRNNSGQLGDGTNITRYTPVQAALSNVSAVAAGSAHTTALKDDGTVWAWGNNYFGQLGDGTNITRLTPVQVAGGLSGVSNIAAGYYHTVALKDDGTVWAWGYNYYGQLGDGTNITRLTPVQAALSNVSAVAAGGSHTVALKDDGTVWAWGYNYYGQLGDGTMNNRATPVQVRLPDGTPLAGVIAIEAGDYYTAAMKADGTIWVWGDNSNGQLARGAANFDRTSPMQVAGLADVTNVAAGMSHAVAVKSDGNVWAWGYNEYGQLGDNTTEDRYTPVQVSGLAGVTNVAAGGYHTVALKTDGSVWAWGYNYYGQLGDGTNATRLTPVQVTMVDGTALSNVTAVAAGYAHTVALKTDGTVWAWGYNNSGQLGDGTTTNRMCPVQVKMADGTALSDVIAIAAGASHTLAMMSDGSVWVWGNNNYGQLGDGTTERRLNPVEVPDFFGIVAIGAGNYHSLAVRERQPSVRILTSATDVAIPEGGTATFQVKLSAAPAATVMVTATRTSGDADITAQSGTNLTFTTANWSTYQTVTLAAAQDADTANGGAVISLMGVDVGAAVTATENDNDTSLTVASGAGGMASPAGMTNVTAFAGVAIVATPDSGYVFDNWSVVSGVVNLGDPMSANTTVAISGSAVVQANFISAGVNRSPMIVSAARADASTVRLPAETAVHVAAWDRDGDPLTYAWSALNSAENVTFAAGTSADSAVTFSAPGLYVLRVTVSDGRGGNVISEVSVTVKPVILPPTITQQPGSHTVCNGQQAQFWVEGTGEERSYQWYRNGVPISSAVGSLFSIENTVLTDNGAKFSVRVTNPAGSVTSDESLLTVLDEATGTGLTGNYFNNYDFTDLFLTRVEGISIGHYGGYDYPFPLSTFSVRWTGQVRPKYSETYTFESKSEGGTRLWVNGVQLFDSWGVENVHNTTCQGTIALEAGRRYDIQFEYGAVSEQGQCVLDWFSAHSRGVFNSLAGSQMYPAKAPERLVASASVVSVPEGGTNTFQVKLPALPAGSVTVAVDRVSGDSDITVQSGTNLTFTTNNWDTYQTVTLAAANDGDISNSTASIVCSAAGISNATVTAVEVDTSTMLTLVAGPGGTVAPAGESQVDRLVATQIVATAAQGYRFANWSVGIGSAVIGDVQAASTTATLDAPATLVANFVENLAIKTGVTNLSVPEGGTATFDVRLSQQPTGSVVVAVAHTAGDADITVQSGASLTFSTGNWDTYQTVTLAGAEDADTSNGTAIITCSAAGLSNVLVPATETDNSTTYVVATGGSRTNSYTENGTNWTAHIFTTNGTLSITTGGYIEYFLVGGGGSGGRGGTTNSGGGGGGGGVRTWTTNVVVPTNAAVTVGIGGPGRTSGNNAGLDGGSSSFLGISVLGGAGGGGGSTQARSLGCGGGGGGSKSLAGGTGTAGQGYNGGASSSTNALSCGGGGGGGAGQLGVDGDGGDGGNGGNGVISTFAAGMNTYYGGGGGGSGYTTQGQGGLGGGAAGRKTGTAVAGTDGLGGGSGGGHGVNSTGKGGSGTVIIRYVTAAASSTPTAPTGLVATASATNQIELAWSDNATNETDYVVDRSLDSTNWTFVTLTAVDATNYSDTGRSTNTLYYYRVAASNASGRSAYCYASARTWTVYEQWQRHYFDLSGLNNLSISGAMADPDHDGLNNEQEYWAGTIPTNAASCLVLYALTNNPALPGEYVVRWQSATGRVYTVQAATNLVVVGFTNLATHLPATPPVNVHTDAVGSAGQKFYRVKVE